PPMVQDVKPSVLAVCFFSSPGAVGDNFHTLCRSLAGQSHLSVLTSRLLEARSIPGADALYVDVSKRRPLTWLAPTFWTRVRRFVRREPLDLLFIYSEHPLHVGVQRLSTARRSLFW